MEQKKILIMDDDHGILEMLEVVLDDEKFKVATESNSLRLLKRIDVEKPDLLIIDLWMPQYSGDEAIRDIRATDLIKDLKILAISASKDGETVAMGAGADDYLPKPFDIDELFAKMEKLTS